MHLDDSCSRENRSTDHATPSSSPELTAAWRTALPGPNLTPPDPKPWALDTEGACASMSWPAGSGNPFDIDESSDDPEMAATAKAVCASCPLRRRCLEYAMANEPFGIWGGLDALERHLLRGQPLPSHEERLAAAGIRADFARGQTAQQVADRWGVTRRTVERWRSASGLTAPRDSDSESEAV